MPEDLAEREREAVSVPEDLAGISLHTHLTQHTHTHTHLQINVFACEHVWIPSAFGFVLVTHAVWLCHRQTEFVRGDAPENDYVIVVAHELVRHL